MALVNVVTDHSPLESLRYDHGHASISHHSLPLDSGEDCEETIPDEVQDSDPQTSDEESVIIYHGDSEANGDSELDPDAIEGTLTGHWKWSAQFDFKQQIMYNVK